MKVVILANTRASGVHFEAGEIVSGLNEAELAELLASGKAAIVPDEHIEAVANDDDEVKDDKTE